MNNTMTRLDFERLLEQHEQLRKRQRSELQRMPKGSLNIRKGKGRVYYYHCIDGRRRGITSNQDLAFSLARKKYLNISLKLIERNIHSLISLVENYHDLIPEYIIGKLPHNFQALPQKIYLPYDRKRDAWMDKPYEQSDYHCVEKDHVTAQGLWVRSKSEVIIAEKLDAYHVPYRYEQMLYIEQYHFAPDFTILTQDGLKYWEHCGLVNDKAYMRKHHWKMSLYGRAGIVPWKNLIVTYDDENGGLDSRIIESEIVNKLL